MQLSPGLRRLLTQLRIGTRSSFQGRWHGERPSRSRGVGLDFADYRPYQPGDDLRYVDWNLYARLGRLYLKLFVQEQNLPVTFMVDVSGSMGLGQPSKLEYARNIVTSLAYAALAHADAAQVVGVAERIRDWSEPLHGKSEQARLYRFLSTLVPTGETDLAHCAREYVHQAKQAGVLLLLSDAFVQTPLDSALTRLRAAGHEVHFIHTLSRDEVAPSEHGDVQVTDIETHHTRELALDESVIAAYVGRFVAFCSKLRATCLEHGATYTRCVTDETLSETIQKLRTSGVLHG